MTEQMRLPAEQAWQHELDALRPSGKDNADRPFGWELTPGAVVTYLLGGKAADGTEISAKYIGTRRLIESAVATLATDRALLLLGVPGTAKSWVSEHLAAAITGDSTRVIQCTAGTDENQIRYGWNYAELLAKGPSREALVQTPLLRAMETGTLCRLEELTRMGSEVQDTLITVLSEKMMPIPELNTSVYARRGFNVIATANNRDKGVNELSAALKRRFNVVVLPLPDSADEEVDIVVQRLKTVGETLDLKVPKDIEKEVQQVVTMFRELRAGETHDGRMALKTPTGNLSTAEAISVMVGGLSQATWFNDGRVGAESLAAGVFGAIVKDPVQDTTVLEEYLETVLKKRKGYSGYYSELNSLM